VEPVVGDVLLAEGAQLYLAGLGVRNAAVDTGDADNVFGDLSLSLKHLVKSCSGCSGHLSATHTVSETAPEAV
jgi:hypothetical protein